jgi:hypothetical protein
MATGPDGIGPEHFRHLGQRAMKYLTELFNLSVGDAVIPSIWKQALILPVVKPGKPASQSTSFRPISLLCPAAQIFERLLLPDISQSLPPSDYQHGFHPMHSTHRLAMYNLEGRLGGRRGLGPSSTLTPTVR